MGSVQRISMNASLFAGFKGVACLLIEHPAQFFACGGIQRTLLLKVTGVFLLSGGSSGEKCQHCQAQQETMKSLAFFAIMAFLRF